jgi:cell division protein FtsQ
VFALRRRIGGWRRTARPGAAIHAAGGPRPGADLQTGLVLPRFLRRPARWAARAVTGETRPPRFAATMMTALVVGGFGIYGTYAGGHFPAIVKAVAAGSGLAVDDIRIEGNGRTSEIDVLGALELDGSTALMGFSAEAARSRIAALPWVEAVSVRKSYPSTLAIDIVERQPFAIWQNGSNLSLIERDGDVILPFPGQAFAVLPLVIGIGAPEKAEEIISLVAAHPAIASRVKAYIRVADRRWDLRLENGITVKLPDMGEVRALAVLAEMERNEKILSRDIAALDMRLADRFVVRLTPEAALRRAAFLAERAKRRPEKGI